MTGEILEHFDDLDDAILAALDDARECGDGSGVMIHAEWCRDWMTSGCTCKPLRLDPEHVLTRDDVRRVVRLHAEMWKQ